MIGVTNATGIGNEYLHPPAERVNGLWGSDCALELGNDWGFSICKEHHRRDSARFVILKVLLKDELCVCVRMYSNPRLCITVKKSPKQIKALILKCLLNDV